MVSSFGGGFCFLSRHPILSFHFLSVECTILFSVHWAFKCLLQILCRKKSIYFHWIFINLFSWIMKPNDLMRSFFLLSYSNCEFQKYFSFVHLLLCYFSCTFNEIIRGINRSDRWWITRPQKFVSYPLVQFQERLLRIQQVQLNLQPSELDSNISWMFSFFDFPLKLHW